MKLLLFSRWKPDEPGGPEAVVNNLVREFAAAGHEVEVCWLRRSCSSPASHSPQPRVTVTVLPSFGSIPVLKPATKAHIIAASEKADFAFFFSVFVVSSTVAAGVVRCPYAAVPLGGYARAAVRAVSPWKKRIFTALFERRFLERAAFVNAWSNNEIGDIEALCRPRRCVVTPPGFTRPNEMPARLPRRDGKGRSILFLGRFAIEAKGLDRLVAAFTEVAGSDDRLTLAGADFRGGLARLERLVASSPARDRITVRGPAWGLEKYELFQQHDVFTHLSRWEGMPLALVEALCAGMPALVSSATNAGDHINAYGAGWVVGDDAFAAMTARALGTEAATLDKMGAQASRLVAERMRWPEHAAALLATI